MRIAAQFLPADLPLHAARRHQRCGERALEIGAGRGRLARRQARRPHLLLHVGKQQLDLAAAAADAEEFAGQVRQLVRFVEDQRIHARQQVAETVLFERQVRQQQMMIDDHDVGFLRRAARLEHVAAREIGAARAGAVLPRGADVRPQRVGIGEWRQLCEIAAAGRPATSRARVQYRLGRRGQQRLLPRELRQPRPAQVIGPSLEQRDPRRAPQGPGQQRQVAVIQLVLQRARAGRYQHSQPGQQRRDQIGKGFSGTGTRFDHQHFARRAARPRCAPPSAAAPGAA